MRFLKQNIIWVLVLCIVTSLDAQIITPITFSNSAAIIPNGTMNDFVEDTINNKIYFHVSCNCGPGPGNQWNALSYLDLNTQLYQVPFTYYGPYGTRLLTSGMHYSNNDIYINEQDYFTKYNAATYSPAWSYTCAGSQTLMATAMRNDTIIMISDDGSFCQTLELRNKNTGSLIPFGTIGCITSTVGAVYGYVKVIKYHGNKVYLGGGFYSEDEFAVPKDDNICCIDLSTGDFSFLNWQVNDSVKDIEIYNNRIYIAGSFTSVKGQARNHFAVLDLAGNLLSGSPSFTGGSVEEIEVYDNYLFALGKYTTINSTNVNPSGDPVLKAIDLNTNSIKNWNMPFSSSPVNKDQYSLEVVRNRLYTGSKKYGYWYIDAYCLPPLKTSTAIVTSTTSVCDGSSLSFSVAPFKYVSGYNWSYTGSGASISPFNNTANFFFASGATSGQVKVWANSACGGQSDTVKLNITILPRPNVSVSLVDDTINCFKPKVPILGNSTTSPVSYSWSGPGGFTSTLKNDSTPKYKAGTYNLTVKNLSNGCTSTASLLIRIDTLKPNITLPPGPYQLGCSPPTITLNGSSTTTPTFLYWHYQSASSLTPNPYTTGISGTHYFSVYNTYNGCKDSTTVNILAAAGAPTVMLTSHTFSNSLTPVDTITCLKASVTLSVSFSPTNCSVYWKDIATYTATSNPVTVYGQSNQKVIVTRLDNNCVDSNMVVRVYQNITKPNIAILTPSPNINCSSSSATLNAAYNPTTATAQWTGPASFSSSNPAVTSVQGKYYITVTRPDNGCSKKDSVNVGYSNSLVVDAGNDTTVCKSSVANLSAAVIGSVSSVTYSWSTGASGQSISVNPIITTSYVVTASGPSSCVGYDTVFVNIPADIQDSLVTSKSCSGNNGSLVIYAKGGIPPYKFSLNGGPFLSQSTYTNLPFATYTVTIKDSIGCTRNATADLNSNSNAIAPVFIASTQNFKGDTVVFIDITVPKADSVNWVLPSVASVIGGDMFNPVVVFADTGSFPVTMNAFYSGCVTSATKIIKIMPWDSAYATLTNSNGIKLLNLYPNPNTGQFTIQLEFYKKQNCSVQVWDSSPQKHFQQNYLEADVLSLPMNLSQLQNGTFILRVIGEYAAKSVYFVISK
jgi:hypothetical protein